MRNFLQVLRSGGRWVRLFVLTVLLPAAFVGVLAVPGFRGEALKQRYQREQRQQQILRLIEGDLSSRLISLLPGQESGSGSGIVKFEIDGSEIFLPAWNVTVSPFSLERRGFRLTDEESRLLLRAQRMEAQGKGGSRAVAAYENLLSAGPRLAPLARLGLLRLALSARQDREVVRLTETIQREDHDAVTDSGIPVWVAAGILVASQDWFDWESAPESYGPAGYMAQLLDELYRGAWRLDAAQWALYSRQLSQTIEQGLSFPGEAPLAEIRWRAEWLELFSETYAQVMNLHQTLQNSPGSLMEKGYCSRCRAMIAVLRGEESSIGLVIGDTLLVSVVADRVNRLTQAEDFEGTPVTKDSPKWEQASVVPSFPFVRVFFAERPTNILDFRANFFFYALALLLLITAFGLVFSYRAVSHEIATSRLKSDFVSTVSHELRTPLTGMKALLERLEAEKVTDPEMRKRYLQVMRQEVQRLAHMVDRLLDFSRLEKGRKRVAHEAISLDHLVGEVVESFENLDLSQRLRVLPPAGEPDPIIAADRIAISQCLHNLIDNALKYSQREAFVTVATSSTEKEAWVEVTDEGSGIPASERERIFEQFYRGKEVRKQKVGGAGLGLPLVRGIVESFGGRVTLETRVGVGSTFRLIFPLHRRSNTPEPQARPPVPASAKGVVEQ
jgi:signal transduction histidine kinase